MQASILFFATCLQAVIAAEGEVCNVWFFSSFHHGVHNIIMSNLYNGSFYILYTEDVVYVRDRFRTGPGLCS
jgi:hypothetical protein